MFVTYEQFFIAVVLFSLGYTFGVIYGVFTLPFNNDKVSVLKSVISIILFVLLSLGYYFISVTLKFPNFRIYMPVCVLVGFIAERKTLRLVLANLYKKLYNKFASKKVEK